MTIIYKYTNRVNGKVYVGKTSRSLRERHREHIYSAKVGRNIHWGNALIKWGMSSFDREVLCEVDDNDAAFVEMIFISALCAVDKRYGYNSTDGGEGVQGWHHTEKIRRKISESAKIRRSGFFVRNPIFGKMNSEVVLKRMRSRYGEGYVPRGESLAERKARRKCTLEQRV